MGVSKDLNVIVDFESPSTFTGRSTENGVPVSQPLKSLVDLLAWKPNDPDDKGQVFSVACVRHCPKVIQEGQRSTLVCHDFKGGYLDDRFVQDVNVTSVAKTQYQMIHWSMVDIFVYFSHHFVTVPPVGWINAAHRNGVTILGTFITEWDDGYNKCKAILCCPEIRKVVADRLVSLASFYGFDGWLINIENKVQFSQIPALISFVEYLTAEMHKIDKDAKVIWYDSVTNKGELNWQNELNEKNSCFFDVCDGIFLNYIWTKEKLESSLDMAHLRAADVFVGVDVFGRGCFGGGGFKTSAALEVVKSCGLSAAIFAPGWVYEHLGFKDFEKNNLNFWISLSPYCEMHNTAVIICELKGDYYMHRNTHFQCSSINKSITLTTICPIDKLVLTTSQRQTIKLNISGKEFTSVQNGFTIQNYNHADVGCYMAVVSSGDEFVCTSIDRTTSESSHRALILKVQSGDQSSKYIEQELKKKNLPVTDYSIDDISWKKAEKLNFLLLTFTLFFPKNEDAANITYSTQQQFNQPCHHIPTSEVTSYCGAYRFNNLSVPNSLVHGNCSFIVKINDDTLTIRY